MLSKTKVSALVASIICAVIIYLALSFSTEWHEVLFAYKSIGLEGVALVLALSLVNYGLRFFRWQLYLSVLGQKVPILQSFMIYISGFALTTTPGKAGEMLRGVFLKPYGMAYTQSAAAFLSERLSDLFAIVLLCMLGITIYDQGSIFILLGAALIIFAQTVLASTAVLNTVNVWLRQKYNKFAMFCSHIVSMLLAARKCHVMSLQLSSLALSLIAWSAEAYAFYLILNWTGLDATYSFAFSVYALSMLAGALSFLPGGLGGAEAVMIGLLLWSGMAEPYAIAATVIIRLVTLWFAVFLGVISLVYASKNLEKKLICNAINPQESC